MDASQIQECASRYLTSARMSGVIMVPQSEGKFDLSEVRAAAKEFLSPEPALLPVKKARSARAATGDLPVELIRLPSGIRVAYFERPQSHAFSVHAAVLGGLRMEIARPVEKAETDWGSSYMMSLTWNKGTSTRNAREIAAITEGRAAGMDGFAGRNSAGLQMTGLSRDWGELSTLFTDVLLEPVFPPDEVAHSRRVAEDSVRSLEDHTGQLCSKLFLQSLFEHHPYGRITIGSLESLGAITSEKLEAFHHAWLRPERLVLSVSGSVKRSKLDHWLKLLEDRAQFVSKARKVVDLPTSLPDEPELKAPRWIEKSLGREQTHILIGGLGTRITAEDRHALRLMQTLLGGQSGRLFIELREKKSLAYSVAPMSFEGIENGYVGTYIACSPQKREEAVAGIKKVLGDLAAKGPTAAEMKRAQEFFLGRRAMDLQSDSSIAAHFGLETLYGIEHHSEASLAKKIRAISPREIQRVCRKYLVDRHQVTAAVG